MAIIYIANAWHRNERIKHECMNDILVDYN